MSIVVFGYSLGETTPPALCVVCEPYEAALRLGPVEDMESIVHEVDDPVFADPGKCVPLHFYPKISIEGRIADLD